MERQVPNPMQTADNNTMELDRSNVCLTPLHTSSSLKLEPRILEELAFQQQIMQLKQQQFVQHHLLEERYQTNRLLLRFQHGSQLQAYKMQGPGEEQELYKDHLENTRIDCLRQKDETSQSAVASPEVKRRLQEVILQRKRKDAAASMGNLKTGIPLASSPPVQTSILRKVQSESNLLKIKNKRGADRSSGPYSRNFNHQLKLVPECTGSEDSTPSPVSSTGLQTTQNKLNSSPDSSSPSSPQGVGGPYRQSPSSPQGASSVFRHSPSSPGGVAGGPYRPSPLSGTSASRSLPNIPSSLERSRRSPPIRGPQTRPSQRHFSRSHSSAILPLRKHLIEKSLAEKLSMDDNQYYYQQTKIERERSARSTTIKPLEEVMEEETSSQGPDMKNGSLFGSSRELEENECLVGKQLVYMKKPYFKGFMGPSGLSPLVLNGVPGGVQPPPQERALELLTVHSKTGRNVQQQAVEITGSPDIQTGFRELKTGLAFHSAMLQHQCICENVELHPENPERLQYILSRLVDTGILQSCEQVSQLASLEQIQSCHTEEHTLTFGTDVINRKSAVGQDIESDGTLNKFTLLPCGGLGVDSDTYWNELYTGTAARYAVGSAVELGMKIAWGEIKNGFAIVRPPGHHAEAEEAMGFCYFNTVAIVAKQLLTKTNMKKVLVVDWAIHHGNGTQKMFYEDPRVLYISIHRHDNGNFYPGTGSSVECGNGKGLGFNVNIAWSGGLNPPMSDTEYLAAFRSTVLPIARSFEPDFVLVSAGFDAAVGHEHPIGGYQVSTACFAFLTHQLMGLAEGRVLLVLEGGYHPEVLADGVEQCCRALMGEEMEKIGHMELGRRPCQHAVDTLQKTLAIQSQYWPGLDRFSSSAVLSHLETWEEERVEVEALSAMAGLSMYQQQQHIQAGIH